MARTSSLVRRRATEPSLQGHLRTVDDSFAEIQAR